MLKRLRQAIRSRLEPPLPSAYIASFLAGEVSHDAFTTTIGDGWIGSNVTDDSWLDRLYEIERRYNPEFPSLSLTAFKDECARADLRQLMIELRDSGH